MEQSNNEIGQKSVKKSCSKYKSVPTLFAYPGTYEWGKAPKFCMDVEKGYEIVFYVSHFWFRFLIFCKGCSKFGNFSKIRKNPEIKFLGNFAGILGTY